MVKVLQDNFFHFSNFFLDIGTALRCTLSILLSCYTFPYYKLCACITSNKNNKYFRIKMVCLVLGFFSDPASVDVFFGEKSQSTFLDSSNKPLTIMSNPATQVVAKFTFILMEFYSLIQQLKCY